MRTSSVGERSAGDYLTAAPAGGRAAAQATKAGAASQLPAVENELDLAEFRLRGATAEIEGIESLPPGTPFDQPAPPAPPREIPSALGFGGDLILKQINAETEAHLNGPVHRWSDEPQVRPPRGRDKSWRVNKR